MATNTTNFSLSKPAVNSATDEDLWGDLLNTNMDTIDGLVKQARDIVSLSKTTTYTTVDDDRNKMIEADATAGAFTITLLSAATAGDGSVQIIKKIDSSSNAVTIDADGTETIDGGLTKSLATQYDTIFIRSNGTNWLIVSDSVSVTPTVTPINIQKITSTGTYTPTAGMLYCKVKSLGGGGGGGGANGSRAAGSGGGAGGYAEKIITAATIGASQSVTIGAAGAAGANTGGTGGTGGTTTFGAILTCNGGAGGSGSTAGDDETSLAGLGGSSSGGDININGSSGECGLSLVSVPIAPYSGRGANSFFGSGGRAIAGTTSATAGNPGLGNGSGGSGALITSSLGGAGAAGVVIIEEYFQ